MQLKWCEWSRRSTSWTLLPRSLAGARDISRSITASSGSWFARREGAWRGPGVLIGSRPASRTTPASASSSSRSSSRSSASGGATIRKVLRLSQPDPAARAAHPQPQPESLDESAHASGGLTRGPPHELDAVRVGTQERLQLGRARDERAVGQAQPPTGCQAQAIQAHAQRLLQVGRYRLPARSNPRTHRQVVGSESNPATAEQGPFEVGQVWWRLGAGAGDRPGHSRSDMGCELAWPRPFDADQLGVQAVSEE